MVAVTQWLLRCHCSLKARRGRRADLVLETLIPLELQSQWPSWSLCYMHHPSPPQAERRLNVAGGSEPLPQLCPLPACSLSLLHHFDLCSSSSLLVLSPARCHNFFIQGTQVSSQLSGPRLSPTDTPCLAWDVPATKGIQANPTGNGSPPKFSHP